MRACEGSGGQGDGVADGCELVDGLVLDLVGVQPGVVVGAWVAVGDLAVDHVPDRDERGVLDGDDGLEGAAAGDLQVGSATLFQIAANLLISRPEAHRQASRLLHFSARQPTEATLDRLWGTPFDLLILTTYGDHSLEPTIVEPVLLTFDAGLAAMFDFLRHASFQPLTPAAGPDTPIGSLVASRLDLRPRLAQLQPQIDEWRQELRASALDGASRGQWLETRADEISAMVDREEHLLLSVT